MMELLKIIKQEKSEDKIYMSNIYEDDLSKHVLGFIYDSIELSKHQRNLTNFKITEALNRPIHFEFINNKNKEVLFTTEHELFNYFERNLMLTKSPKSYSKLYRNIEYLYNVWEMKNELIENKGSRIEPNPMCFLFSGLNFNIKIKSPEFEYISMEVNKNFYLIETKFERLKYNFQDKIYHFNGKEINRNGLRKLSEGFKNIIVDPLKFIIQSNISEGECSFCNRPLKGKASIVNGYGKICAEKYNLPYFVLGKE